MGRINCGRRIVIHGQALAEEMGTGFSGAPHELCGVRRCERAARRKLIIDKLADEEAARQASL